MPLRVDVVIPVHGQWELTERCLATLAPRDACVQRIIVVDDTSPDDSAARLRARTDIVPLILERNLGFAGACNAGARAGDAEAIFFLNNDTLVPHGTIDRLAATLAESGAAAVGPRLLNGDGTLQSAGLAMLARQTHVERLYAYLDADLPQAQIAYDPIVLSGAAVLVRRDAFEAAGAFDEAFVNGSEDVDLCLKLWARATSRAPRSCTSKVRRAAKPSTPRPTTGCCRRAGRGAAARCRASPNRVRRCSTCAGNRPRRSKRRCGAVFARRSPRTRAHRWSTTHRPWRARSRWWTGACGSRSSIAAAVRPPMSCGVRR
jgi:GT2 family glycosyltransferase